MREETAGKPWNSLQEKKVTRRHTASSPPPLRERRRFPVPNHCLRHFFKPSPRSVNEAFFLSVVLYTLGVVVQMSPIAYVYPHIIGFLYCESLLTLTDVQPTFWLSPSFPSFHLGSADPFPFPPTDPKKKKEKKKDLRLRRKQNQGHWGEEEERGKKEGEGEGQNKQATKQTFEITNVFLEMKQSAIFFCIICFSIVLLLGKVLHGVESQSEACRRKRGQRDGGGGGGRSRPAPIALSPRRKYKYTGNK